MSAPLYSWGRYPLIAQQGLACESIDALPDHLAGVVARHQNSLPFGNGRSYGDSCLAASDHVLAMRTLDRFIDADWHSGLVRLEAGMTLAQLLTAAVPQGWFLPVTPELATVGGAVANDVHGKNHHLRGTFGCHVRRFGLVRHDEAPRVCSAEENPRLFAASIGGLGLTGSAPARSTARWCVSPIWPSFSRCHRNWTLITSTAWRGSTAWPAVVTAAAACTSSAIMRVTDHYRSIRVPA